MIDRRVQIWIAVVAGLALAALLLLAGRATAGPSPLETSANQPHAVHTIGGWGTAWEPINPGETITFNHNLGQDPDDYAVELWFQDTDAGGLGINRRNYGGMEANGTWHGAYWQHLTANTIQVHRLSNDTVADLIRIRVWVPVTTTGTYDSGWTDITTGTTPFTHSLGITETDLTMSLWFSGTKRGIHHFGYGGLAVDGPQRLLGAHWHSLTTDTVQVTRHRHDTDVEQVRVLVAFGTSPDYDSLEALGDWQSVGPGAVFTFEHDLNWNPDMLLVRGECYSSTVGIHQWLAGGDAKLWPPKGGLKGANVQNLTTNTVQVFRWPNDDVCPQVRVRIWKRVRQIYLPLVLQND
jgi:hypothetical protein